MWEVGGRWFAAVLDAPVFVEVTGTSKRSCLDELREATGDVSLTVEVIPSVVGVAEAAEIMGWDKRRVVTYIDRGSFPEPLDDARVGQDLAPRGRRGVRRGVARPPSERQGIPARMSSSERRLYLIRHGKADRRSPHEAETPRGVAADPPLDDIGREQAVALARRLARMPAPAAIYCSTLTRARQTIEPFVEATGAEVTYDDDLAEWFGGDWEFKEFEELLVEHPEIPSRILLQDPLFYLAPGGEPFARSRPGSSGRSRVRWKSHPEGDLWVVCHGGVINAYLGWFLEIEEQEMFFLPPNTSINTVLVRGDRRLLWFLADDTHFTAPELFPEG